VASDSFLDVAGAEKSFGVATVLGGVDLKVAAGEFVSLLGPSGCGKTTLLRIIAGLLAADRGSVRLDGENITARPRTGAMSAWCSRTTPYSPISASPRTSPSA
jgi:putative spermidine/putrescine transport system ATP-binding protein